MALARVLLVEDEPFARTMLVTALRALGIDVLAACGSSSEALATARTLPVEVALLDLDLGPGPSGIDVAHALREREPGIGLVFLTSFTDPRIKDPRERALPPGSRYIVKSRLEDGEALRAVILDARRDPRRSMTAPSTHHGLTEQQVEVLRLIAAGRSNAEIAAERGVTEKAVERLVQRTLDALAVERTSGNVRVLAARAYAELSGKPLPSV